MGEMRDFADKADAKPTKILLIFEVEHVGEITTAIEVDMSTPFYEAIQAGMVTVKKFGVVERE